MAKIEYVPRNFRDDSLEKIATANQIIETYMADGLKLTLRQLYYQFVSVCNIPNTFRSYKSLANLISEARLAGMIDWDAIEDRGRVADVPSTWRSVVEIVDAACRGYQRDHWLGQDCYAELWVEKEALAGVLEPMAAEFQVPLMVNKGYSSSSAMWAAANRFIDHPDKECVLFYLGDHDPSGEDMVRDIGDRLKMFGAEIEVRKVALTMEQVRRYKLPPNPAKKTDARFAAYADKHGNESWEVDAINPSTMQRLIRNAIEEVIDREMMDYIIKEESDERKKAMTAVEKAFGAPTGKKKR